MDDKLRRKGGTYKLASFSHSQEICALPPFSKCLLHAAIGNPLHCQDSQVLLWFSLFCFVFF